MAAAFEATPTVWNMQHENVQFCVFTKTTAADWIHLKSFKGVIPLIGMVKAATTGSSTSEYTYVYGVATSTNTLSATDTSMPVTSATIPRGNTTSAFYILCPSGEICEVVTDSAPTATGSTFTLKRGCLGTTAAAITATHVVSIMNILFVSTAGAGIEILPFIPLPNENKAAMFSLTQTSL